VGVAAVVACGIPGCGMTDPQNPRGRNQQMMDLSVSWQS